MIRIFILFFLVCINSYSQQWEKEFVSQMLPVDSVIMEIQYSVRFICSKTWVISTDAIKKDTLLLQVGSKSSYSYFYTEKQIDVTTEREFQSYGNRNQVIQCQLGLFLFLRILAKAKALNNKIAST